MIFCGPWMGDLGAGWLVTGVSNALFQGFYTMEEAFAHLQKFYPFLRCLEDIDRLRQHVPPHETNLTNPHPHITNSGDRSKEFTFFDEDTPENRVIRRRTTSSVWFDEIPPTPALTPMERAAVAREPPSLLPSQSLPVGLQQGSAFSSVHPSQGGVPFPFPPPPTQARAFDRASNDHTRPSYADFARPASSLARAVGGSAASSHRHDSPSTFASGFSSSLAQDSRTRNAKTSIDDLSQASSRLSMDHKRRRSGAAQAKHHSNRTCAVFQLKSTWGRDETILHLEREFGVHPTNVTKIDLIPEEEPWMTAVAHLLDAPTTHNLVQDMRRRDRIGPPSAHYRAKAKSPRRAPRPDGVADMDQALSRHSCPFRNCPMHYSCASDPYLNKPQMFQDDEARDAHLSKFHMDALEHADPATLDRLSIYACPYCERHACSTLQRLHLHTRTCSGEGDSHESGEEMDLDDGASDSDDSTPYHESQDVDFYATARAQCPPAHKNELEDLIHSQATHGTILDRVFAWSAAAVTKP